MTNDYLRHRVITCNVCFKQDMYYKSLQPYCSGKYLKRELHFVRIQIDNLLITTNNLTPVITYLPSCT